MTINPTGAKHLPHPRFIEALHHASGMHGLRNNTLAMMEAMHQNTHGEIPGDILALALWEYNHISGAEYDHIAKWGYTYHGKPIPTKGERSSAMWRALSSEAAQDSAQNDVNRFTDREYNKAIFVGNSIARNIAKRIHICIALDLAQEFERVY